MTETPETPTPSLAERDTGDLADDIEAWADVDASNLRSGSRVTSAEQLMGREPDLRAAAAQLRQLDRIKAAYAAVRHEHLATTRPFRPDCDNAKCNQLVRHLAHELDALEADDGA